MNENNIKIGDVLKINLTFVDEEIENLIIELVGGMIEKNKDVQEVSITSPLGAALLNKQFNDEVTYTINGNTVKVNILEKLN